MGSVVDKDEDDAPTALLPTMAILRCLGPAMVAVLLAAVCESVSSTEDVLELQRPSPMGE